MVEIVTNLIVSATISNFKIALSLESRLQNLAMISAFFFLHLVGKLVLALVLTFFFKFFNVFAGLQSTIEC